MSVVAVKITKTAITIGADSIRTSGYTQEKAKDAKLARLGKGFVVGQAGMARDIQLMQVYSKDRMISDATERGVLEYMVDFISWARKIDGGYNIEHSSFLFVIKDKVFLLEGDFFIREIKDYHAIGAGADFALSALYSGADVKRAIDVACELSVFCERPINIIKIRK